MPRTSRRTAQFTESLIREMTRVAQRHGAINLAQGFPDFDPPPALVQAAKDAMDAGRHQYAITWGAPELRVALAAKTGAVHGACRSTATANLSSPAAQTEAMMVAMMTVCDPGDRVGLFSPFYENYSADAILSGATPVHVPLHPPHYHFDPDELRRAFASGLKAFVLCNPSNPTGRVFTRAELEQIAALAAEFDTFSSPTRCTSTSCSTATGTPTLPRCRAWRRARLPVRRSRRRFRSPAGGWVTCMPRRKSSRRRARSTISSR